MQNTLLNFPLTFLVAIPFAAPAVAGGLDKKLVPEGSIFVAHLDVEALVKTKTFADVSKLEEVDFDLEEANEAWGELSELGVDPREDIKSVTIFGSGEDEATVCFVTSAKLDDVLAKIGQQAPMNKHHVDGYELIGFDGDDDGQLLVLPYAGGAQRIVFASDSASRCVQAARVYQGKARNITQSQQPTITASPMPSSVFFVALSSLDSLDATSQIAGMANSFVLDLGERASQFQLRVAAQTDSPDDAYNLKAMLEGLRAMLTLAGDEDIPDFVHELVNSVQLNIRGSEVSLEIELDILDLIE